MMVEQLARLDPLAAQLRRYGVTWEHSLQHFLNIVTRGGDVHQETAQRVSYLFRQGGCAVDLIRWSRLFRCESVAPCSVQIAALVQFRQWTEIHQTFSVACVGNDTNLIEYAAAASFQRGARWDKCLALMKIPSASSEAAKNVLITPNHLISSTSGGLSDVVAAAFASRTWQEATVLCSTLETSGAETQRIANEILLSRLVSAGQGERARALLARLSSSEWSPRVAKNALRLAISYKQADRCLDVLDLVLSDHDDSVLTSWLVSRAALLVCVSGAQRSQVLVLRHLLRNCFYRLPPSTKEAINTCLLEMEQLPFGIAPAIMNNHSTIQEADDLISLHLRNNRWLEALEMIQQIKSRRSCARMPAQEVFLVRAVQSAASWKDALDIFA